MRVDGQEPDTGASVGRAGNVLRSPYPSRTRGVDPATVHGRRLNLPREICSVSLRRLGPPRDGLTAGQKSAEGVLSHVVGKVSEALRDRKVEQTNRPSRKRGLKARTQKSHRFRLVGPVQQLPPNDWPVLLQIVAKLIDRHLVDACATFVAPHLPQCFLQIPSLTYFLHDSIRIGWAFGLIHRRGRFDVFTSRLPGFTRRRLEYSCWQAAGLASAACGFALPLCHPAVCHQHQSVIGTMSVPAFGPLRGVHGISDRDQTTGRAASEWGGRKTQSA